jgi:hypothetical protein
MPPAGLGAGRLTQSTKQGWFWNPEPRTASGSPRPGPDHTNCPAYHHLSDPD